uniref:Uncharacterized protein n=1 Tax=Anguilla anguilla TaxID=7936 RepID=A0A0E9R822_ANGAN
MTTSSIPRHLSYMTQIKALSIVQWVSRSWHCDMKTHGAVHRIQTHRKQAPASAYFNTEIHLQSHSLFRFASAASAARLACRERDFFSAA